MSRYNRNDYAEQCSPVSTLLDRNLATVLPAMRAETAPAASAQEEAAAAVDKRALAVAVGLALAGVAIAVAGVRARRRHAGPAAREAELL